MVMKARGARGQEDRRKERVRGDERGDEIVGPLEYMD